MFVYLYDTDFKQIAVFDNYISCIWHTSFFDIGDFELKLPATSFTLSRLKQNYYLVRDKDITDLRLYNVMIIKTITITTSQTERNQITVSGYCLKSIFQRRVISEQFIASGLVTEIIRRLVTEHVIDADDTRRNITNFTLTDFTNAPVLNEASVQLIGDQLNTAITTLCQANLIGWDIFYNTSIDKFVLDLKQPTDHSYNQTANNIVVFSPEFDNLISSTYTSDTSNYKNVAIIGGEGDGNLKRSYTHGTASGLSRYEIYVDANSVSSNNGEISDTEYNNMLKDKGVETLSTHLISKALEGDADTTTNFVLGVDFNLGDLVQIDNGYGVSTSARVTEVIESISAEGTTVIPTFVSD